MRSVTQTPTPAKINVSPAKHVEIRLAMIHAPIAQRVEALCKLQDAQMTVIRLRVKNVPQVHAKINALQNPVKNAVPMETVLISVKNRSCALFVIQMEKHVRVQQQNAKQNV